MKIRKIGSWLLVALLAIGTTGWLAARNTTVGVYFANTFSTSDWQDSDSVIEVPISRSDTHIVIPVYLNGEGPFRFVLDTGAPMTAIFGSHRTNGIEFGEEGSIPVGGSGSGSDVRGSIARNIDVGVGTLSLNKQTIIIMQWDSLPFAVGKEPLFDGVIGYDLLRRYPVELDISNHVMRIYKNKAPAQNDRSVELPVSFSARKPYIVAMARLGPDILLETKLQLDIGSTGTLSLLPDSSPEIRVPGQALERFGWGLSGRTVSRVARIPSLYLDKIEMTDVITAFSITGSSTSGDRQGLIGLGLLDRFDITIDYPANRVVLHPTDRLNMPFEIDMSGMALFPEDDRLLVRHVYPGSQAEAAGIQSGDHITSINGKSVGEYSQRDVISLMRQAETTIEMCLETKSESVRCTDVLLSRQL